MTSLHYGGIALRTLGEYWPVFAAGALVELWIVGTRMRRPRPFPPEWALTSALAAALIGVALWVEPFLATQLAYQTVGEGARPAPLGDLQAHVLRSWPLTVVAILALMGLLRHPRSTVVVAALVAGLGVVVSWMAAMWLFATNHSALVFRVLIVPGGLGAVASLAGFTTATALWIAIGRWVWRQGRRARSEPPRRQGIRAAPVRALSEGAPRDDGQG